MTWLKELWRRAQYLLHRKQLEAELAEEMHLHRELRAAEAQSPRRFGNVTQLREESRAVWISTFWETLGQDMRYGLRALAANPGFTIAAVASLALGIGANTAIFSIVNAVMLRSLPVEDPQRLVQVRADGESWFTNPIWEQVRDHQQAFSGMLAYGNERFDLTNGGESRFAQGLWVSGDFFRVLGVNAWRGRLLTSEDDRHGGGASGPVAVISHAFWQSHFAGDPGVTGKTLSLNRHSFQIVGVVPPWFRGLDVDQVFDVAIPIGCESILHTDLSALTQRTTWWLSIVGRLPNGKTIPQAQAQLNSIAPEINQATLPQHWPARSQKTYLARWFELRPASTGFAGAAGQYRTALFTLMGVAGLVLLIACANIANLLLARAVARQREISVRLAIGAGRWRLVRQLLTESLLLACGGAASGLLLALWSSKLLVRLLSTTRSAIQLDLSPDGHVLAFTAAIAILTGLLFSLVPALRATNVTPSQVLKEAAAASTGWTRLSLSKVLVIGQVCLSLALLVGAGLFIGTLKNLISVDPGFNRRGVLVVSATLPATAIHKELRLPLFQQIADNLRRLPGVDSAAISRLVPIGRGGWNNFVIPQDYKRKSTRDDVLVYFNRISRDYFDTMQTPLQMGRDFSDRDDLHAPKVMIIGETTARHFWGDANPLGKTISIEERLPGAPFTTEVYEVIGVSKDTKYRRLDENPLKTAFVAMNQDPDPRAEIRFEIRSAMPLASLIPAIHSTIGAVNKNISLEFQSLETQVEESLVQQRLLALLSSFFGFLALLLAMVGLYGVISYGATRRRGEIGIRMALGAEPASVVWLVLRGVLLLLGLGAIAGIAVSLASARLIKGLLYGVPANDPATIAIAVTLLSAAAVLAGYLPARRAASMDPMAALRNE